MCAFASDETEDLDGIDKAKFDGRFIGKKRKQYQQKKKAEKAERQNSSLRQQDLVSLNITDPQTKEEASSHAQALLDLLGDILSVCLYHQFAVFSFHLVGPQQYLHLLQEPSVCLAIRNLFSVQQANHSATEVVAESSIPAAHTSAQPMKA